jgi:hypothetical protein
VHGFHTYPARLHPDTAARLVRAFCPDRGRLLDPFCGSGTVLVEGLLAGRDVMGTDLNPLAILLSRVKATPMDADGARRIAAAAADVAEAADARRKARAGATRRLSPEDVATFDPHVLLELDGLRAGIEALAPGAERDALWVVLGALLVKVSRKRGDTASGEAPKRIASGFTIRFFVKKASDLVERRAALAARLPSPPSAPPRIAVDDATELKTIGASTVDAIVTSPPYAATYDYLEHHALRLRWLGLDARPLERREMGARRSYAKLDEGAARQRWLGELTRFLRASARVVRVGGPVILVVADSAVRAPRGGAALRADELVAEAMEALPFEPVARASQARPHFHGPTAAAFATRARHEHALFLRRVRG